MTFNDVRITLSRYTQKRTRRMASTRCFRSCICVLLWLAAMQAGATDLVRANAQVREHLRQVMVQDRVPGMAVVVVQDGRVVLSEHAGFANVENKVPVSAATLFPINSATKAFTGVAVMQLVQEGKVDLDAQVSSYLHDLPPAWRPIRVRQLLGHLSGLPDMVDARGAPLGGTEQAAWQQVRELPMQATPGSVFAYNQTNYFLLARIISACTGQSFESFMRERQFAPTGMASTTFGDSYDLIANAATVYAVTPRGTSAPDDGVRLSRWFHEMPYGLWAGGGIHTTSDDLARWVIALMAGDLLDRAHLDGLWTPQALDAGTPGPWALGWPVLQSTPTRQVAGIGGARAAFVLYPDEGLAIIVLTNLAGASPQRYIPTIAGFYLSPQGQP